jgi:hypothetical protein
VEKLEETRVEARRRLEEEGAQRRELHDERYARAREEEKAKREQLTQIERELRTLLSDDQIQRFVSKRRESEDYRKHLGVIASARQDFEQLSRLLEPHSGGGAGDGMALSDADEALERELDRYRDKLPRIERIILYIDDLDRCPEAKVVDVLQAVHLLLAFKLFVVVVGVDPRWLLHSLAERSDVFREAEDEGDGNGRAHRYWRTTPMDYLEKIFQIPFHLRPMGEQGFDALVTALTRDPEGEAREEGPVATMAQRAEGGPRSADEPPAPLAGAPLETGGANAIDPVGDRGESGPPPEDPGPVSRATPEAGAGQKADSGASAPPDPGPDGAENPRLTIASWERRFMKALHPFIRSPRSAKRFVNVYRLVRATHIESLIGSAASAPEGSEFHGDDAHHQVLFLLAMLTGFPGPSFSLFRLMRETPSEGSWGDFRTSLVPEIPPDHPPAGTEGANGERPEAPEARDHSDGEDWREFVEALARVQEEMAERGILFDPPVRELRAWIPKVARYSFRSGEAMRASD